MFTWKKLGRVFNPVDITDRPWLREFAQAPCVLHFDSFLRVYFSCRPPADANGQYVSNTGYVDISKKNLFEIIRVAENPILGLGELGAFDEFGVYPTSVIRNSEEVWAYYGGWTRCESVPYNVSIGLAISHDDGQTFKRAGSGPLISYSLHEPMTVSGPKIRKYDGQWYMWYVVGKKWIQGVSKPESVFKIRMAQSSDGINWNRINRDIIPDKLEENECQASPDVFFSNGKYHMFFCYKFSFDFRNKARGYRIGYAYSTDMLHWTRDDSKAGIDVSDGDEWDSEMISYPHIFQVDKKIYMFYLGNQVGRFGFGLAELQGSL